MTALLAGTAGAFGAQHHAPLLPVAAGRRVRGSPGTCGRGTWASLRGARARRGGGGPGALHPAQAPPAEAGDPSALRGPRRDAAEEPRSARPGFWGLPRGGCSLTLRGAGGGLVRGDDSPWASRPPPRHRCYQRRGASGGPGWGLRALPPRCGQPRGRFRGRQRAGPGRPPFPPVPVPGRGGGAGPAPGAAGAEAGGEAPSAAPWRSEPAPAANMSDHGRLRAPQL